MNVGTLIFMLALAALLVAGVRYRKMVLLVADLQADLNDAKAMLAKAAATIAAQPKPAAAIHYVEPVSTYVDRTPLAGAGNALAKPPADLRTTINELSKHTNGRRYFIPLGWSVSGLTGASLQGDVNHILISGMSNAGKDNAALGMLLSLALTHSPQELQIGLIDGKGLDWLGWRNKAHTWLLADEPERIGDAMAKLTNERRRRREILANADCANWDEYHGHDLPLLVVFISELSLLEDAVKARELGAWLNSELSAGRAFGIRYIIGTQNASNFETRWRGQISLHMASSQPNRAADEPNTGMATSDLEAIGVIPPSKLIAPPDGAGVFTVVQAPKAVTVRVPFLTKQHRKFLLDQLPDAPKKPLQQASAPVASNANNQAQPNQPDAMLAALLNGEPLIDQRSINQSSDLARDNGLNNASGSTQTGGSTQAVLSVNQSPLVALPVVAGVDPAEVKKIAEAAPRHKSRSALCNELYGIRGGTPYNRVKLVCDALGLLEAPQIQQAA
ncbi:FtsK/SpoIIIE domain-containing protein [Herpetosiphon gulosus]